MTLLARVARWRSTFPWQCKVGVPATSLRGSRHSPRSGRHVRLQGHKVAHRGSRQQYSRGIRLARISLG